jgi:hypothetical protein
VAFVIDVNARRIVGWNASRSIRIDFPMMGLEQVLSARCRVNYATRIHHRDRGVKVEDVELATLDWVERFSC